MTVKPRVDCRFFGGMTCAHPARRRSWFNPWSWVGFGRPACLMVLDPFGVCPFRERIADQRPAPSPFMPAPRERAASVFG